MQVQLKDDMVIVEGKKQETDALLVQVCVRSCHSVLRNHTVVDLWVIPYLTDALLVQVGQESAIADERAMSTF